VKVGVATPVLPSGTGVRMAALLSAGHLPLQASALRSDHAWTPAGHNGPPPSSRCTHPHGGGGAACPPRCRSSQPVILLQRLRDAGFCTADEDFATLVYRWPATMVSHHLYARLALALLSSGSLRWQRLHLQ
jgi:hypothetical protein